MPSALYILTVLGIPTPPIPSIAIQDRRLIDTFIRDTYGNREKDRIVIEIREEGRII